jgi:polyferredoxin
VKLSDDEARRLAELERMLRQSDPRFVRRLARLRVHWLTSPRGLLVLGAATVLGVALVAVGDLLGIIACLIAGIVLIATVPGLAVIGWARRYYCRYCAGKWPAPAGSCPRCERRITV